MNFGASIVVARSLGPSGRGTYALAVLIPVLVSQTLSLGLNKAAVYFVGQGQHPMRHIVSTLHWFALALGSIGGILTGLGLMQWGTALLSDFPPSLLPLALVALPFLLSAAFLGHVLLGQERTISFALQGLAQSAVLLAAQTGGFIWARGQINIAVGGWVLSQLAAAGLAFVLVARDTRPGLMVSWDFLRQAVRYSRAGYVTDWLEFLNLRLDQFLVQAWSGSTALGQYAVAVSIAEALWQLPISVGAVLFARVAAVGDKARQISTARVARLTMLATLGLVLLLAATAHWLIPLLFGEEYRASLPALYILLPGTVALVLPKVIGGTLYGRGLPQYVTYGAGLSLVVTILADVTLIPRFGIWGAGLASSLAYSIFAIYMVGTAHRLLGEPWAHFLPFPRRGNRSGPDRFKGAAGDG